MANIKNEIALNTIPEFSIYLPRHIARLLVLFLLFQLLSLPFVLEVLKFRLYALFALFSSLDQ